MRKTTGFTLVEIMIVIAILGVLAAVAIPMYNGYVEGARETEAKSNLQQIRAIQEQYFADRGVYCVAGVYTTGNTSLSSTLSAFQPGPATKLSYDYEVDVGSTGDDQSFLAKATRRGVSPAKFYTINEANERLDQDGNPW